MGIFRFLQSRAAKDVARIVLSLAIVAAGLQVMTSLGGRERPRLDRTPAKTVVEVMRAVPHQGDFEFEVDGIVVPYREIDVAAEVAGRVIYKSQKCRAGEPVREGDLLFRIDEEEYELEVQRLKELVEQAVGARDELEVELESAAQQIQFAEEELTIRQRELARFENGAGFSRAEIDVAKRNELMARDALQARKDQRHLLQARIRRTTSTAASARTQLARAQLDLDRAEVRSPITGVIVTESVQQESFVAKGGMLVVIRDTSRMEVRCNLQMQQMQWLWESTSAEPESTTSTFPSSRLGADPSSAEAAPSNTEGAGDGGTSTAETTTRTQRAYQFPTSATRVLYELNGTQYAWDARLTRYANSSVDNRTRMVPCIAEVTDPEKVVRHDDGSITDSAPPTLLSGMFVTLRVRARLPRGLLQLPVTAVGPAGDVWLVDQQRMLRRTRGEVLQADQNHVLVEQTPALTGALIVTSPLVNPMEGAPVTWPGDTETDMARPQALPGDGSPIAAPALPAKTNPDRAPSGAPSRAPSDPVSRQNSREATS